MRESGVRAETIVRVVATHLETARGDDQPVTLEGLPHCAVASRQVFLRSGHFQAKRNAFPPVAGHEVAEGLPGRTMRSVVPAFLKGLGR